MKYSIFIMIFFVCNFVFVGCNDIKESKKEGKIDYQNITTGSNDYNFKGLSFFVKNATYQEIVNQLTDRGIFYTKVMNDDLLFSTFHLGFECCPNKTTLYLPYLDFGPLRVYDIFLIFQNDVLVMFKTECVSRSSYYENINGLAHFFYRKYIDTSTSVISSKNAEDSTENFTNKKDTITVSFLIDKVYYTLPLDENGSIKGKLLDKINIEKKIQFRNKYKVPKEKSNSENLVIFPNPVFLGTKPKYFECELRTFAFQITFPNKLQECCDQQQQSREKIDSLAKSKDEREILKSL